MIIYKLVFFFVFFKQMQSLIIVTTSKKKKKKKCIQLNFRRDLLSINNSTVASVKQKAFSL